MKKLKYIILIGLLLTGFGMVAQDAPLAFNYQAVARNIDGDPMMNTLLGVRISLLS